MRKRRTSSFIMPEVISRLRRMQPDEAYVQAAQRVVLDCLAVKLGERLLIVYQQRAPFEELAAALMMAADEVGAEIDAVTVTSDETSPRLMAKLKERCDKAAASAMLAGYEFSRDIRRVVATPEGERRHVHMLGLTDAVVRQSLRIDYRDVHALGERLRARLQPTSEIRVESAAGTSLTVKGDPSARWINAGGLQHGPGWTNLPAGELVTTPSAVDGVFVPDGGLRLSDGAMLDRAVLRRMQLTFMGGRLTQIEGPEAQVQQLEAHLDSGAEGRRVGQIIFGTNVGVIAPIGVACQDGKLPGLHLVLSYTAPEVTGARWCGELLVQLLGRQSTVRIDGVTVMDKGRYVADL
ncbi:MAG: hypothetical protein RLP09_41740 [Sandaracinaceae bacterium]